MTRFLYLEYLVTRVAFALFLVLSVSSASLVLTHLAPGDYVSGTLGIEGSRHTAAEMRERLGLNKSLVTQYREWLTAAVHFDFGRSLLYDRPVRDLIPERAVNTAILALAAVTVATLLGIPLGIIAGSRPGAVIPHVIRAASMVLLSMPPRSAITPPSGATVDLLQHLLIPAAAIGLPLAAMIERLQAQAISEVLAEPYVLATLARGLPRSRVIWRHAFKASLRPVASVYGLIVATLLSGSFVVEVITAWPGLGSLMLDALRTRDVYLVVGCAGTGAVFLAAGTLLSDLALVAVDPRTKEP